MTSEERVKILDDMLVDMKYEAEQCGYPHLEKVLKKEIEALQYVIDFYESNS